MPYKRAVPARHPPPQQMHLMLARVEFHRCRHGVGEDREPFSLRKFCGTGLYGGAHIQIQCSAIGNQQGRLAANRPLFGSRNLLLGGIVKPGRFFTPHGPCAAMKPLYSAGFSQRDDIASHGLGGNAEPVGKRLDRGKAALLYDPENLRLALGQAEAWVLDCHNSVSYIYHM